MHKRLPIFLIVLLFIVQLTVPVIAIDKLEQDQKYSLTVNLEHNKKALTNVGITIHKVADLKVINNQYMFEMGDDYTDLEVDVNKIDTEKNKAYSKMLADHIKTQSIGGTTANTDVNGIATFKLDEPGMYLVSIGKISGYNDIAPYLVSVPGAELDDDGNWLSWLFEVNAAPKTEPTPVTTTRPPVITTPPTTTPPTTDPPTTTPPTTTPPVIDIPEDETPLAPPEPNDPGNTLVPDDDGFTEIDDNDVPQGSWKPDDDGVWIYDPNPPLANLPQTGLLVWPIFALSAAGIILFTLGWIMLKKDRKNTNEA